MREHCWLSPLERDTPVGFMIIIYISFFVEDGFA